VPRGNNSLLRNKPKASTSDLEKQLRIVTLERDQLRLELEKVSGGICRGNIVVVQVQTDQCQAKRSLLARRKKHHEAREIVNVLNFRIHWSYLSGFE
ncbi:TPA: hypothetical protein N0F65_001279, partial [Lagenidium giganteum]